MGNLRHVYMAAILFATAGIHTSTSWGASWIEINNGLPVIALGVNSLAIDPVSPSTIYAQTIGNPAAGLASIPGLFRTTDRGATWKAVGGLTGVTTVAIDPKNSSVIYAGTMRGLVKTTDRGESWIDSGTGLPNGPVTRLVIDPISPSTLYAVCIGFGGPGSSSPVGGIFKTTNGGESWKALDTGIPANIFISLLVLDPVTPSTIYASAPPFGPPGPGGPAEGVILKSTDGGETWSALDTGLPPPAFLNALLIDPVAPSTMYALGPPFGGPAGILKSTDGGKSWAALSGLPANTSVSSLIMDPKTPSTLYGAAATFSSAGPPTWRILKTTDGGQRWNTYEVGLPASTSISSLAVDPITPSRIYATFSGFGGFPGPGTTSAGGVLVSVDGGQNWTAANTGLSIFEVRTLVTNAVDASTVYAGGFGGAFKSTDGGATWNGTGLSAYTGSLFADLSNPKIVYAQTGRPFGCSSNERPLLRTADEGANWSDAVSPLNSGCILNVSLASAQPSPLVINPTDPKTLYLGESAEADGYSAVLKSTDGGANWIATWDWFSGLRGAVRALAIDPARPATIYAGIDDFTADSPPAQPMRGLFKSTDGGLTWSNTGLTRNAVNLLAIDPSNSRTFYAAAVGPATELAGFQGLFKSTDGGTTWREINQGLAGVIGNRSISATALVVDRANSSVLYLGTSTRGVFRTVDGGANWAPFNDGLTNVQIRSLAAARKGPRTLYAATASGVFKIVDE